MISSEKNKDLWIEDYIKRVKVLSAQEIKLLETSWSSENNKVENYFRTDIVVQLSRQKSKLFIMN